MSVWTDWIKVLKNAYGSVPPLLQSPIGKFANWIRENYGKDVVGFESSKTLNQLPDIKLDKSGKLDLSTIDFTALKQSISQAPSEYQALFDQLTKANLALPTYSDSVRDFLNNKKLPNGESLDISYDNKTRTVLVNGKTFLTPDQFIIGKDQRAMSNSDILDKAYTDYLASNFQITPETKVTVVETPKETTTLPDFSKMTPTELTDWITGKGYEGELDYYTKTLDMLNQKDNAMTQRINDLWDPYIESATDSLDAAYKVQKSALESQTGGIKSNAAANIANIERAIMSSRARTKEDMNARGLLFSGLLTRALTEVEATGVSEKAKVYAQETSDLNKIAAQIAVLTANLPIEKNNLSQQLTFQKGLQLFNLLSANDVEKDKVNLAMAQTETNIKNLQETAGARGEIATREEQAAQAEAQAKADQQNFENYIKESNLLISQGNLALTAKMDDTTIKNIESQIKKRDADIWKIYQDVGLANAKFAAEGTTGTTMKLTDAQKLLDKQNSLLADITQLTKITSGTGTGMSFTSSDGTTFSTGSVITQAEKDAAQAVIDNDKQQLSLLAGGFVQAKATVMAQWSPDEADALIGIQQWIYQYFNTTSDNELSGYLVKQVLETGQYDNMSLQDYLKKMGYSNAWTILTDWANLLPVSTRGQGH